MEIKLNYDFERKADLATWLDQLPVPYNLEEALEIDKQYEIKITQWNIKNGI